MTTERPTADQAAASGGPPDGRRPEAGPTELMAGAAAIVAGWPRVRSRLYALHVAGPDGRCRACTSQVFPAPRWPCAIAVLARCPRPG